MQVLVVDDQHDVLMFMQEVLACSGYDVLTAPDGASGLQLYSEYRPSFTLTDISMPGMTGIELLKEIKAINAEAAVMLMTGAGNETFAVEALRNGAVNYFNKPVDINELINTLTRYASLAAGFDYESYASQFLVGERLRLSLRNNIDVVNHAVQMIINHCRAIFPLGEIFTLRFGLYEMLVNAIEHGNLGITYAEKSRALEDNRLTELLQERVAMPDRAGKRVSIDAEISLDGLICTIKDEGEGFDHSVYSQITDPAALFEELGTSLHGRGIILTCLQFDAVRFNDKGNEVRIVKRAPRREASQNGSMGDIRPTPATHAKFTPTPVPAGLSLSGIHESELDLESE